MKQRILLAALALSLCISIGIGMAAQVDINTPMLSYTSYTDRPYNFEMTDTATVSGFNSFTASTLANAGGVDEMTKVATLPCGAGAPEEKSYQNIYMDFYKDGTTVDPAVEETLQSDITVGSVNEGGIVAPTGFDTSGNLQTTKLGEGYDIANLVVGGIAGSPITTGNTLTGITDDYQRYVFSNVQSYQDDFISATGRDSAGTLGNTLTSYTTAATGSPTLLGVDTPYNKFDWQDMRGYSVDSVNNGASVAWSGVAQWTIQNSVNFAQILPVDYRTGAYV